jgi:pimeloyl-ACP methyl ester carboxylesterase
VITTLRHHRIDLALHELRAGSGRPLLLLHGLADATPPRSPAFTDRWPGPIFGLDFTGHGHSTVPVGGGYSAEVLMGDADTALQHLGPATVLGQGLGAYIALLISGARPQLVRGAILADGPGISGGAHGPTAPAIIETISDAGEVPDRWALLELSRDPRPADYAVSFVRQAVVLSGLETPIAVTARSRPPWLLAVAEDPAVIDTTISAALDLFADQPG